MPDYRVLYIDDETDICEVAAMSLELDPSVSVRTCTSGETGLAEAADSPPDLILLDVMMPDVDGPQTLTRLRANPATAHIPVVFITARTQKAEIERFMALGAAGVIAKPFDPMALAGEALKYVA